MTQEDFDKRRIKSSARRRDPQSLLFNKENLATHKRKTSTIAVRAAKECSILNHPSCSFTFSPPNTRSYLNFVEKFIFAVPNVRIPYEGIVYRNFLKLFNIFMAFHHCCVQETSDLSLRLLVWRDSSLITRLWINKKRPTSSNAARKLKTKNDSGD